jgi:glycosyltransferase involved in cell wall biosynthesis
MNIGVDIRSLMTPYRTGVGEYTFELLNTVFTLDQKNQYFLFYNSYTDVAEFIPKWQQKNVHFIQTRYPNKLFNASLVLFKRPRLDQLNIKILQYYNIKYFDVWFSPNLNFTALSKRTKFVLTIHDLSFEYFPDCFSFKQRWWHKLVRPKKQCERADLILTPSENTKRDIVEKYQIAPEKVKVVYPGLSPINYSNEKEENIFKQKYHLPDKYILFLGTIEPRKNLTAVVAAYQRSNLYDQGYRLIIAGAKGFGSDEILNKIEQVAGVRYLGYVDPADKFYLYKFSILFVCPSLYEGFGFPLLEAMSAGVPVIASNRSSLPEVAADATYLVNPHDINEIANGMKEILFDERLKNLLVERGKRRVEEFKWEKAGGEFVDAVNKILKY